MGFKLRASVSDTDLLINLANVDKLDILETLFSDIIVPRYILHREVQKKSKETFTKLNRKIHDPTSAFKLSDREQNRSLNLLAKPKKEEYDGFVGPGEAECAGYASALGIDIILSDNTNDFEYMEEEFIMLRHIDILTIMTKHELIDSQEATDIYNAINETKNEKYRFKANFNKQYNLAIERFINNGWGYILGIE